MSNLKKLCVQYKQLLGQLMATNVLHYWGMHRLKGAVLVELWNLEEGRVSFSKNTFPTS